MKRALITGITGFVGPYLRKELEDHGYEVFGTSRNNNDDEKIFKWELQNREEIRKILKEIKPDVIMHLAGQSSVHISWQEPYNTMRTNIIGLLNLFEEVEDYFPNIKLIIASSSEIYGITNYIVKEDDIALESRSPYAISRVANDEFVRLISKTRELNTTVLRLFNHTGPGQSETFVIPSFAKQLIEIKLGLKPPIVKVGNLEAQRDFSDVRDVCTAYRLMANYNEKGGYYNVCSGKLISVRDILNLLIKMAEVKVIIEEDIERIRPSDMPVLVGDYEKINKAVRWKPTIPLEKTLNDILKYWFDVLQMKQKK